ncbi:uncharacterized protein LOC110893435 [Helianthus annuus]|uniref:uncharacterized protein LOC110893435 n=1 Tax=Helianthus annuus TaxID=4232 RepID=UPI000B904972|nr:uncharacterized protein LOC110893435 [Helianthus annuus]
MCDFQEACLDEERFLKQKSKVEWLRVGDSNSAYFHMSLKSRNHRSCIDVITDANGTSHEGDNVPDALVNHYENFLGYQGHVSLDPSPELFTKKLDTEVASNMVRPITLEEIKSAMFAIGNDKAPGPDGFTAAFFKNAWDIVGSDISNAVLDFFNTGKLLKQLNHMLLILVPKITTPSRSAFVPGRKISDNILLTQELMHNYHRNFGPRCAFKVDIQKAYDTVDWDSSHKFWWVLVFIELWFHNKCEKQHIVNLCFADDLFLFARGDVDSARCIMNSLKDFSKMSGLVPSSQKSTGFFCNVPDHVKMAIMSTIPFMEVKLPVRYLGVPLLSTRLLYKDCNILVERLDQRIHNWKNKLLSFACRLQLIISVLSAMHVYWSSVFILPARIIHDLEAKMRNFLWSQGSFQHGKAKVSWKSICVPKLEGGLGIRQIGDVNKALMVSHVWSILTSCESLWVAWIHSSRLKGRNFWDCKAVPNCCWSWRKLLQLWSLVRGYIWSRIGDGRRTSAWHANWSAIGPLSSFLSARVIIREGFSLQATVADVSSNGSWLWPDA